MLSNSNAVANGVAGAGGGIIAQIITYPLQTVNTRQQTERRAKHSANGNSSSPGGTANISSVVQILQVLRSEGLGGLYSGLKPALFGTAASQGIYYYFYQVFKNKAEAISGDAPPGMLSWLVVAALAGSLNVLFTNPIWVLVTRMQTHTQAQRNSIKVSQPRPYGTLQAANEVYAEAGIAGFWKGIVPTLIMVCNPSIQFMIYESLLKYVKARRVKNRSKTSTASALEVFLIGALAKLGATVATYPLLVVKSRLQAKQEIGGNVRLRYTGTIDAVFKMIKYEGFGSFYKGMSTKIVQSVFAASILFMLKEELLKAYMLTARKFQKLNSPAS